MRIAIIGSGVSGLVCAHLLDPRHAVTLFESGDRPGGHTNTVEIEVGGDIHHVDTGFIVYNERTYPAFTALLRHLGVATKASDMSFSVSDERTGLEWRGTSPSTVFAQRRNLANPAFQRMLLDVTRFNRAARRLAADPRSRRGLTLGEFLARGRWSPQLVDWYLVPLGSAIWSADPASFTAIPAATFARFFDNHGLLRLGDQPRWRTVEGGAARYIDAILGRFGGHLRVGTGVEKVVRRPADGTVELLTTDGGLEAFDHVVVATHSDQALRLLADATPAEREVLGAIRYQPNQVTLHTDARLMPRNRRAWASWNYHRMATDRREATVTYNLNLLQGIESRLPILETLNRAEDIDPRSVLATFEYAHPVLDAAADGAQRRRDDVSGRAGTSYAGAYWGYGFHEDGVQSALHVCRALGVEVPW
ncbi:MAG TPA: FAD-dependent oxidoreductase [Acidimicrobiales bacterium]|nr:FAD-dependent oxidoreductase [Acidimicrobiales bacterium]